VLDTEYYNTTAVVTSRFAVPMAVVRAIQWAALLVVVVLLGMSSLTTAAVPMPLRAVVVGTAILAAISPRAGLVAVAGLAPLGYVLAFDLIARWQECRFDLSQAVVLAYFAGYLWATRRRFLQVERERDSLALPAAVFSVVVVASLLVDLRVLQVWHDYPLDYTASLFRFLHSDFLVAAPDRRAWVDGRGCITGAAYLIEGVALFRCARVLADDQGRVWRAIALAFALVSILGVVLGLQEPLQLARAQHRSFWSVLGSDRWSTPVLPSINGAGQFFMLLGFVTVGGAAAKPGGGATGSRIVSIVRIVSGAGAAAAFSLMWVTQTRSAIVGAIAATAAVVLGWMVRRRGLSIVRTVVITCLVAACMTAVVTFVNPFGVLAAGVDKSLEFRYRFAQVGWSMFRSAPLMGVGVGQYDVRFFDFASKEVLLLDPRVNNTHNYLLWMAAELGLTGLLAFLWFLCRALWESTRNVLRSGARDRLATFVGLFAFLITWSVAQPLNIQTVAFPFWLIFGLAASSPRSEAAGYSRGPLSWAAAGVLTIIAVASVPARAERELKRIDYARVAYGLYNTGVTEDQRPFTWAGPRVRLFMRWYVPAVDMSVGSVPPLTPHGANVRILVDSQPAQALTLAPGEWRRIRVVPGPRGHQSTYWRIDIEVDPIDLPRDTPENEHRIGIAALERLHPSQLGG
jgi:O-antigen ligase